MKRLALLFLAFIALISVNAQTDFRHITYQEALETSKAEGKLVFIDFYTSWCGPCKAMAKNIFPLPKVGEYMNAAYVNIKLDAEKEGKDQAVLYKVDAYPTMIVVDATGKEIFRKVGGTNDPDAFIAELKVGSNTTLTPELMAKRYEEGDRSAELVNAYASSLYRQGTESRRSDKSNVAKAHEIVEEYFSTLSDEQKLQEDNFFVYSYNFLDNPAKPAAQFLFDNKDYFPASMSDAVNSCIDKLLRYRMGILFQGGEEYTQNDIDVMEKAVQKTGLGTKDEFVPTFKVLSAMLQNNDEVYLNTVQKYYDKMNTSDQINVAMTFGYQFRKNDDKALLTKANKWIRSKLPTMDSSALYYVAQSIITLERLINPEQ